MAVHKVVDDTHVGFRQFRVEFGRGLTEFYVPGEKYRIPFGREFDVGDAAFDVAGLPFVCARGGHGPKLAFLHIGDTPAGGNADGLGARLPVGKLPGGA